MPDVSRVTAVWTGFPGAPGVSKFSFLPLTTDAARNAAGAAVRSFFFGIQTLLPNGVNIAVQPTVDDVDVITGKLTNTGSMSSVPTAVVSTTTAAPYAAGSGCVITWLGSGVFAGRRIKGRTFIVPIVGGFESNGSLVNTTVSLVQSTGDALIAATGADLAIWSRTWSAKPYPTPKDWFPTPLSGNLTAATGCVVADSASQLRSRRQ